ncbi:hypothetical protein PF008_g14115 [Phytophthora fragariae]|uniref:RxLR effector protein n=1 Tax=Phytophthora fragariae TaxID=53985 RepID=A0A6G0RHY1_9STRA|nr:hypothetical protein PF008_g14115 [Phytophthora fragariae]
MLLLAAAVCAAARLLSFPRRGRLLPSGYRHRVLRRALSGVEVQQTQCRPLPPSLLLRPSPAPTT